MGKRGRGPLGLSGRKGCWRNPPEMGQDTDRFLKDPFSRACVKYRVSFEPRDLPLLSHQIYLIHISPPRGYVPPLLITVKNNNKYGNNNFKLRIFEYL